jgi:hypothetical protein
LLAETALLEFVRLGHPSSTEFLGGSFFGRELVKEIAFLEMGPRQLLPMEIQGVTL